MGGEGGGSGVYREGVYVCMFWEGGRLLWRVLFFFFFFGRVSPPLDAPRRPSLQPQLLPADADEDGLAWNVCV